ncbi:MAG: mepA 1 [Haloplasmataceae bacterium]|jgi:putative MATE family efflux protein|nr:mepA 1 [Haloplasmataceae bacterium]
MKNSYNLTHGNIIKQLLLVSVPVILTSFVQMLYNLTDIYFLGQIVGGNLAIEAVAAAGTAGFYIWLGAAVTLLVRIGTEVRVSQSYGRNNYEEAKAYAKTGVQLEAIFAFIYSLILFIFADQLIDLFRIDVLSVYNNAVIYLRIIAIGMTFNLLNPVLAGALNGTGNTLSPFLISSVGLVLNIILDYIFIFPLNLGVLGAAFATIIAQVIVTFAFIIYYKKPNTILHKAHFLSSIDKIKARDIIILGRPVAIQSAIFTMIAIYLGVIVFEFGQENGTAVHRIGSQIEAISWLTAGGIQTALGAFVGQNYGAKKYDRVIKGIKYALISMTLYGIFTSLLLYLLAGPLFSIFLDKKDILPLGIDYLHILAFSQLLMIIESVIGGAFNGLGKTIPSSIVGVAFNIARIPMAYIFTQFFGLNGIWIAITISSNLKGLVIYIWFKLYIRNKEEFKHTHLSRE